MRLFQSPEMQDAAVLRRAKKNAKMQQRAEYVRRLILSGPCESEGCDKPSVQNSVYCDRCDIEYGRFQLDVDKRMDNVSELSDSRRGLRWIYFIEAHGVGLIKIGQATNVNLRMGGMQVGSPVKLMLLVAFEAQPHTEQLLHKTFHEFREHGEWFRPEPSLCRLIAKIKEEDLDALAIMHGATGRVLTPKQ